MNDGCGYIYAPYIPIIIDPEYLAKVTIVKEDNVSIDYFHSLLIDVACKKIYGTRKIRPVCSP
jgi:hypothetical protein